jgi:hypothetical protein
MKELLHKISSILVAFLVLFSTLSFTVDRHYCGERLIDVAVFSEASGCGMEIEKGNSDVLSFSKKSCCKNETSIVEGNSIDQQALQKLKLPQIHFLTAFLVSYDNFFVDTTQASSLYLYKPPIIHKDITLLFENFRI